MGENDTSRRKPDDNHARLLRAAADLVRGKHLPPDGCMSDHAFDRLFESHKREGLAVRDACDALRERADKAERERDDLRACVEGKVGAEEYLAACHDLRRAKARAAEAEQERDEAVAALRSRTSSWTHVENAVCPECGVTLKWSCGTGKYPTGRAECQDGRRVSRRWPGTGEPCSWGGARTVRVEGEVFVDLAATQDPPGWSVCGKPIPGTERTVGSVTTAHGCMDEPGHDGDCRFDARADGGEVGDA